MYCNVCGKQIFDDSAFCNQCGTPQQSGSAERGNFNDAERDMHRYTIDNRTTLVITTKRVVYDVSGFLGTRAEIPLRHITGIEKLGNIVRVRRADGSSVKFNFGKHAEEVAQSIRDAVAQL